MIAIAIVEDDQQEQKRLQQYLMRYAMENQQTFSFALYSNALDYLEDKQKFDIVFMDIMLPNMRGMEAAARMREYDSKTVLIFVTTMVQFAIKSYEVDALDYIVKPVNYARLTMKLQKAIRVIESNSGGTVVINDAQGMIRCSTNELLYVEVHGHKLDYHTTSGIYSAYGSLNDLERVLHIYNFMRCNACYLVNPQFIKKVNSRDLLVTLSNDESLKISQTRRKGFINELTNWLGQGKS